MGANIGDTAILLDQEIEADFLCIEGNTKFYKLLTTNTREMNNILPCQAYMNDAAEKTPLAIHETNDGTSYLGQTNQDATGSLKTISFSTLDNILIQHPQFQNARILKIDTDGFDFKVLRGASRLLAQAQPVIYFELAAAFLLHQNEDPASIFDFLHGFGYRKGIFYDNTGFPLLEFPIDDRTTIDSLVNYSLISDKLFFDVLLFPGEQGDGYFEAEARFFPMKHALTSGKFYFPEIEGKRTAGRT